MMEDKVDIEIFGRKLTVEFEGLTHLEVTSLAQELTERMRRISRESEIVDSSKLAILAALECLADLSKLRNQNDVSRRSEEQSLERMIVALQTSLDSER